MSTFAISGRTQRHYNQQVWISLACCVSCLGFFLFDPCAMSASLVGASAVLLATSVANLVKMAEKAAQRTQVLLAQARGETPQEVHEGNFQSYAPGMPESDLPNATPGADAPPFELPSQAFSSFWKSKLTFPFQRKRTLWN